MPISISEHFKITESNFNATGAFNAILDVDSLFFIDPKLLEKSKTRELRKSYRRIQARFKDIIDLLKASTNKGDIAWRNAEKLFSFPEVRGLCIGYGNQSTQGSGMGPTIRSSILDSAKQIISMGIENPRIFELVGLFEEDVGADRISDMIARIIYEDLLSYTQQIFSKFSVKCPTFTYHGNDYKIPRNPDTGGAVVLVPREILSPLPVAYGWDSIDTIRIENDRIRKEVNELIGKTWKQATSQRTTKEARRKVLTKYEDAVKDLLKQYEGKIPVGYDFINDPSGEWIWYQKSKELCAANPLALSKSTAKDKKSLLEIAKQITLQFKRLVEDNALYELLYDHRGHPKHERAAQKLYFGVAVAYCKANDLDISPESNAGRGPVDFKFSKGYIGKVVVEVKLSTNSRIVDGHNEQLKTYKIAESADESIYVIVDVGKMGDKLIRVNQDRAKAEKDKKAVPSLVVIDARPKPSASKLKGN